MGDNDAASCYTRIIYLTLHVSRGALNINYNNDVLYRAAPGGVTSVHEAKAFITQYIMSQGLMLKHTYGNG